MNVTGVNSNLGLYEQSSVKNSTEQKSQAAGTLQQDTVSISQEAQLRIGTDPLDPKKRVDAQVYIGTDPLDPKKRTD